MSKILRYEMQWDEETYALAEPAAGALDEGAVIV